jgi:hypothetical protein
MIDLFDELADIVRAFDAAEIPYALAGGLANSFWNELSCGEEIDVALPAEHAASLRPLMASLGFDEQFDMEPISGFPRRRFVKHDSASSLFLVVEVFTPRKDLVAVGVERRVVVPWRASTLSFLPRDANSRLESTVGRRRRLSPTRAIGPARDAEEVERRLRVVGKMRHELLLLKREARRLEGEGKLAGRPTMPRELDYDYWAKRRDDIAAGRLVLPKD